MTRVLKGRLTTSSLSFRTSSNLGACCLSFAPGPDLPVGHRIVVVTAGGSDALEAWHWAAIKPGSVPIPGWESMHLGPPRKPLFNDAELRRLDPDLNRRFDELTRFTVKVRVAPRGRTESCEATSPFSRTNLRQSVERNLCRLLEERGWWQRGDTWFDSTYTFTGLPARPGQ